MVAAIFRMQHLEDEVVVNICWTESLSVGIERIDRQHLSLILKIADLALAIRMRQGTAGITGTLEFLTDYTLHHFSGEEKVMMDPCFPEIIEQTERHQEFRNTPTDLESDFLEDGSTDSFADSANTFLFDWLSGHIATWVRRLGGHLRGTAQYSSMEGVSK